MRLGLCDWERLGLYRGQRVPVRRDGQREEWLFLTEAVELPPVVARGEDAHPVPMRGPPRAARGQGSRHPPWHPTTRAGLPQVLF